MARNAVATGFDPGVQMKVGIVGTGAVGATTGMAVVERGVCGHIVANAGPVWSSTDSNGSMK